MTNEYSITAEQYVGLYERYLRRPPDELLLAAGNIKGKMVLDLCAGTLRASNRAKELGASWVVALDKSKDIMPAKHKADRIIVCDINKKYEFMDSFLFGSFDLVVCQQAINYWFNSNNIETVCSLLKNGSHFIFNTFNTKPYSNPNMKSYGDFAEVVQVVDDVIYHLQMRKGFIPHYTSFKWIPPDEFESVLNTYFRDVKSIVDKTTTIYVCER